MVPRTGAISLFRRQGKRLEELNSDCVQKYNDATSKLAPDLLIWELSGSPPSSNTPRQSDLVDKRSTV